MARNNSKKKKLDTSILESSLSFIQPSEDDSLKPMRNTEDSQEEKQSEKAPDPTNDQFEELPVESEPPTLERKQQNGFSNIIRQKPKYVTKTFRIREDVVEKFDDLFQDKKGKKIPGTKGLMSKVVTNALIKEMVELGELEVEYLNKLDSYSD